METITIELGGKKYKVTPVEEELTLEDCVKDPSVLALYFNHGTNFFLKHPTDKIHGQVLLYGLLKSVAHKLNNGDNNYGWIIVLSRDRTKLIPYGQLDSTINPAFKTKELAEQAIRIFENSRFDLKKLFQ